jgi:magnesium transporter
MREIKLNKTHWMDFQNPTPDDIAKIRQEFNLHPLIIEEFTVPTLRPKAVEYDGCLYLAIHIPLYDVENKTTYPAEVDVVISKGALITSHDHSIYQLTKFFDELEENEEKRSIFMEKTPGAILYYIIEMLFESCFPKLDHIVRKLDYIEDQIFAGNEKEMVFEISVVKRDILNFRRTMKPQRSVIESLAQRHYCLIEESLKPYYQDLTGTNIRIWNGLESLKETIESMEATNNSLLSNKLNLTMKVLTIFSAILLPLTVYSNIMSMSVNVPLHTHPFAFWVHTGIMLGVAIFTIILFKLKKWL